jgi:hypothetical protein
MFLVKNMIRRVKEEDGPKRVLVIGSMSERYINSLGLIKEIEIFLYNGKWGFDEAKTSKNIYLIQDLGSLSLSHVDVVLCIDRNEHYRIGLELSNKYHIPIVVLDTVSSETYVKRPYSFNFSRIEGLPEPSVSVSMFNCVRQSMGLTLPYIKEDLHIEEKNDDIISMDSDMPPNIIDLFNCIISKVPNLELRSLDTSSSFFLSSVYGITENVVEAALRGQILFLPSCKETEELFVDGKDSFIYKDIQDLEEKVLFAKNNLSAIQKTMLEGVLAMSKKLTTSKEVFCNGWKTVLRQAIKGE